MKLLSIGTNAKTAKSDAAGEYLTAILYLAPAEEAGGKSVCSFSTAGCRAACLYTAGRGNMPSVVKARIARTQLYLDHRPVFMGILMKELVSFVTKCAKENKKPAVRLNGTSDILWERELVGGKNLMELFPEIRWYDYTKVPSRMTADLPANYSLTFSRGETTTATDVVFLCSNEKNVSVVFNTPKDQGLPNAYLGIPVIDGRTHDLRFIDPKGVIVGLSALGKGTKDTSGFVVSV